ncbi:MNIO family bufferin maturase [Oceanomicrobium pacificus]|uniref:UPF0276 protein GSH16_12210 n=1 Tax=Oceanomicrobium pacificus TaxID=2692916 RepID=A0A6B0TXL8_9RHOB|nr:DUF692 domain-containing protein [Oceanomicrobium pacificus]MXU66208.1 DUF692 family protein [Oceanomicrobium pacificus]
MTTHTHQTGLPPKPGVGYKPQHIEAILDDPGPVAWLEIHAENYMGGGGVPHAQMRALSERFPISCHGVGLSIGGNGPLDRDHLDRLRHLVEWLKPAMFSEHLAWSTHETGFLNDLLPLPYTSRTAQHVADHIDEVQTVLGRQMLLENPSVYVAFAESTMSETDFLRDVAQRSGCGLLLDVNNVYVSATNQHYDPDAYLRDFPMHLVGEIHLGGHDAEEDDRGDPLLIDTHDREVIDPVWALYETVIARHGAMPTLIEWDSDIPDWPVLEGEARRADAILSGVSLAAE